MMRTPVFFLSDFGNSDTYAAQMKAAVLSFSGYDTPVVDLTHEVPRGSIIQGAFHLRASLPHLPEGSVTVAVVDPGVGSSRKGLAALWRGRYLVAPDNGLISLLHSPISLWELPRTDAIQSSTFHGRDWFAPCAARLAVDPGWTDFMKPLEDPVLNVPVAPVLSDSSAAVTVLHTDSFGNCILGMDSGGNYGVKVSAIAAAEGNIPVTEADYYSQGAPGEVLLIPGSQGFMELALRNDSAAERLNLKPGMEIRLITGKNR